MKALVISDTNHRLTELPNPEDVDLIITCGDILPHEIPVEELNKPIFGVYGNHDNRSYLEELGAVNLHLKVVELNGLKFGGFESCINYKPQEKSPVKLYTQEEVDELLKNFPPVDVFVAHSPPFGLLDIPGDHVHTGFFAFKDYLDRHHPKIFLCGHSGENDEIELNGTKIYRTEGYRILDI